MESAAAREARDGFSQVYAGKKIGAELLIWNEPTSKELQGEVRARYFSVSIFMRFVS
jgi:hypothetical protein